MEIDKLGNLVVVDRLPGAGLGKAKSLGQDFSKFLGQAINSVNDYQQKANKAIEALATGRSSRLHETMMAMQEAELSLNLFLQVRNKILAAYREIMSMHF